jgi:hypothetical protein
VKTHFHPVSFKEEGLKDTKRSMMNIGSFYNHGGHLPEMIDQTFLPFWSVSLDLEVFLSYPQLTEKRDAHC